MGLLHDLSTKYKTLSIVGMAKNAGKTTALNYLIEEAIDEGDLIYAGNHLMVPVYQAN